MIFYLLPLNFMMIKRMQFEIFLLEVPNSWLEIRSYIDGRRFFLGGNWRLLQSFFRCRTRKYYEGQRQQSGIRQHQHLYVIDIWTLKRCNLNFVNRYFFFMYDKKFSLKWLSWRFGFDIESREEALFCWYQKYDMVKISFW